MHHNRTEHTYCFPPCRKTPGGFSFATGIDAVFGYAVHEVLKPVVKVTAADWEHYLSLQKRASKHLDVLLRYISSAFSTEWTNAVTGTVEKETG